VSGSRTRRRGGFTSSVNGIATIQVLPAVGGGSLRMDITLCGPGALALPPCR